MLSAAPTSAQDWFQQGRAAAKEGRFEAALKAFETAQELEPALGTLLNISDALEKLGRTVEARQSFVELQIWALRVHDDSRAAEARRRIAALEATLGRVELPLDLPEGVAVVLGGHPVERTRASFVLAGEYDVVATAAGRQPWTAHLRIRPGTVTMLAIPPLAPAEEPVHRVDAPTTEARLTPPMREATPALETAASIAPAPKHGRRWTWVAVGLTAASLATAIALHVGANNDHDQFLQLQPGTTRNTIGERSRFLYELSWGFYAGTGGLGLASLLFVLFE
jgi:tetratricopeptide (TPR) repeat protein